MRLFAEKRLRASPTSGSRRVAIKAQLDSGNSGERVKRGRIKDDLGWLYNEQNIYQETKYEELQALAWTPAWSGASRNGDEPAVFVGDDYRNYRVWMADSQQPDYR